MTAETYLSQIRLLERILEHKHDEIERLQDKEDYRGVKSLSYFAFFIFTLP